MPPFYKDTKEKLDRAKSALRQTVVSLRSAAATGDSRTDLTEDEVKSIDGIVDDIAEALIGEVMSRVKYRYGR